jgi:hypothetical protein
MKTYYYIYGTMGMKSSGSFTRDMSSWAYFTEEEAKRNIKPYGATKQGVYIETSKYGFSR